MPSCYQKIEAKSFRADFCTRNILCRDEPLSRQSIDCCIVSGSLWYKQVSFMVTNRDRKPFRSPRKNSKCCSDDWLRWCFWSEFRHFGTHCGESFRVSSSPLIKREIKQNKFSRQKTWRQNGYMQYKVSATCIIARRANNLKKSCCFRQACTDLNKKYMKVRSLKRMIICLLYKKRTKSCSCPSPP